MRSRLLLTLLFAGTAYAEKVVIYYDYVEEGRLAGGRLVIDTTDVEFATAVGLIGGDTTRASAGWSVTTIMDNGPVENRVDIVMLGDGYTAAEMGVYAAHVDNVIGSFFADEPLAAYAPLFNVHRVDVISNESGVDEPGNGIFVDTALDMTYDCAGIDRLLCVNVSKAIAAAASAPDVDQILVLANSSRYGGAGYPSNNLGTLAGNNGSAVEIALHEFGHSFADLADEYDYGGPQTYTGPEPGDANVTIYSAAQLSSLETKWFRWLDLPHVDVFEGAMYSEFGIYRPTSNSKMRNLGRPFQEVNVEQFVLSAYQTVSPIDDATPPSVDPLSPCTPFFVTRVSPADHLLTIQWSFDSVPVPGENGPLFAVDLGSATPGNHQVSVTVTDPTSRVRDEAARANWMTETRQWPVFVPAVAECDCVLNVDCYDGDVCTFDQCTVGTCGYSPNLFGDVDHNGAINLFDLFCVIDGFADDYSQCPKVDIDIEPCGGNDTINLSDLFAVLGAFSDIDPCCGP